MSTVTLTVVSNEMEAEVVCGLLRSNGIRCGYRKSNVAAAINEGTGMGGPTEVLVADVDVERARELLPTR